MLLADEPTGDLDNRTAESVFELISRLHASLPAYFDSGDAQSGVRAAL